MAKKKVYGKYKIDVCPFCDKQGIVRNKQGVPVCPAHRESMLMNWQCRCGEIVEIKQGKYGTYGLCQGCGPMSYLKLAAINLQK